MLRAVAVVGFRKSGKTTVVEGLVRELAGRGYRVGTIKHIREKKFSIDVQGKDTWRHAQAGARVVVSMAPQEVATITKRGRIKPVDVLRTLQWLDFIIIEGFRKVKGITKIATSRTTGEAAKLVDKFTIACVGSGRWGVPVFSLNQIKELANVVEKRALPVLPGLNCGSCEYKTCEEFALAVLAGRAELGDCLPMYAPVRLRVDGKVVTLNPFVQGLIAGAVKGMLSPLKGTRGRVIELVVRKHV
jgi:molybdopterin-guanine dinucleotide biosynthesis protein B